MGWILSADVVEKGRGDRSEDECSASHLCLRVIQKGGTGGLDAGKLATRERTWKTVFGLDPGAGYSQRLPAAMKKVTDRIDLAFREESRMTSEGE